MDNIINEFKDKFNLKDLTIYESKYWVWSLRPLQPTPGAGVLSLKRPCEKLSDLNEMEFSDLCNITVVLEKTLKKTFGYDILNYLMLMMVDRQVHYHVIPRYEKNVEFADIIWKDKGWPGVPVLECEKTDSDVLIKIKKAIENNLPQNLNSKEKRYKVGYTTGVYDMFHIGHLNILKRAKEHCDYLIVGVTTDEMVSYKNKMAIVPHSERMEIIENIKCVDKVVPQDNMDKMAAWEKHRFDVMFVGSDWKGTDRWNQLEKDFGEVGVDIVYFPYTKGTSSTQLRETLDKIRRS